jgi:oligopeptide/dipeptide ABC transporter ATP-binding protein
MTGPLVDVHDVRTHFPVHAGTLRRLSGSVRAVDGVSLAIAPGETVGLVGESGSGKSTLGRTIARLVDPSSGRIAFDGADITHAKGSRLKSLRRDVQFVFQDAVGSLNPRKRVGDIIGEGLAIHGLVSRRERSARVRTALAEVGLDASAVERYPHEFSGGQRQRIGIARALVLRPRFVIADEPVSALDVSIQSQVLNLMLTLQREHDLTYLFIAHDLAVVSHMSDRVAVMYLGKIVEFAPTESLYRRPLHPYTRALLSAIPEPSLGTGTMRVRLSGEIPSPLDPPSGCRFRTRCPLAQQVCAEREPPLEDKAEGHVVACHFA